MFIINLAVIIYLNCTKRQLIVNSQLREDPTLPQ